jgi:hypothetical protein
VLLTQLLLSFQDGALHLNVIKHLLEMSRVHLESFGGALLECISDVLYLYVHRWG